MVVGSSNNDALLIFVSFYNKLVSQWTVIFHILALNVRSNLLIHILLAQCKEKLNEDGSKLIRCKNVLKIE